MDPAQARGLEAEKLLLDAVEALTYLLTRELTPARRSELLTRMQSDFLAWLDQVDEDRHKQGACAGPGECGHCDAAIEDGAVVCAAHPLRSGCDGRRGHARHSSTWSSQARKSLCMRVDNVEPIPPCEEPGEVEVRGYRLCRGCADALDAIAAFGESARRRGAFSQVIRRFLGRG